LIWDIVPDGMPYELVNVDMTKKNISRLINYSYRILHQGNCDLADQIMYMGSNMPHRSVSHSELRHGNTAKKADIIRAQMLR